MIFLATTLALTAIAAAQTSTTLPAIPAGGQGGQSTEKLEAAANAAFEAKDYAAALPLLQDLSVRLRDQPERVAPLLEKIRVAERNAAPAAVEGVDAPRTPHPAPTPGQPYTVTLQKLGNFAFDGEKGGNIPADVTALSGSSVKVSGYMIPIDQSEKITKFVLVPSLFACCFGQPPSIQHTVMVSTPPGKAISYFAEQIDVTGTLKVQERKEDGFIQSIFELEATSIRPSPGP